MDGPRNLAETQRAAHLGSQGSPLLQVRRTPPFLCDLASRADRLSPPFLLLGQRQLEHRVGSGLRVQTPAISATA